MVIKSDKSIHSEHVFSMIFMIIAFVLTWYVFGWIAAVIINVPIIYFIMRLWIFKGRTLVMDSIGCTICFWKFKKTYMWNELKNKSIERWYQDGEFRRGMVFSKRKFINHEYNYPEYYAIFAPFDMSIFYVYFSTGQPMIRYTQYGDYLIKEYIVNEEEFVAKMHEWNVKIGVCMEQKSVNTHLVEPMINPDLLKAEQKTNESMKRYIQEENQKLKNLIQGYNKCRVYKIQEMLKYTHETCVVIYSDDISVAVRSVHEKNRRGEVVKNFYIEDKKYERLEEIGDVLDNYCDAEGFLTVGVVDSSLLDCHVRHQNQL